MAAAGRGWRAGSEVARILAEFDAFGAGASLAECPALAAALSSVEQARAFAGALSCRFAAALAEEPLAHPPFRHGFDGHNATLLLARAGRAQLALHAFEPGEREHWSARYSDAERHEVVLAGEGRARLVRRLDFTAEPLALTPGTIVALDLANEALQLVAIERRLVTLRIQRGAVMPGPSCEYALADGVLLHQAAGDARASRTEVALALLGRMERLEAAPAMAAIARDAGDPSLRWQALRECLALDAGEGLRALSAVIATPLDPLAGPARALRDQLVATHPELAREAEPCPA